MPTLREQLAKTPKAALRCSAPAEVLTVDNGEGTKSIKVNLKARSKLAINHWWFGNLYHDFAGMTHRNKITIDYQHEQPIGYANRFDVTEFGLEIGGVVVKCPECPEHASNEVAYQLENGIPLEASIDFSDPDMRLQLLDNENQTAEVNGETINGPACIVRNWQLRAVAICKEGYDSHTSTDATLSAGDMDLSACLLTAPVEPNAPAGEAAPAAVDPATPPAPEEGASDEPPASGEGAPAPVDPPTAPAAEPEGGTPPEPEAASELTPSDDHASRLEALVAEHDAVKAKLTAMTAERDALLARVAALAGGTAPVPRSDTPPATVQAEPKTYLEMAVRQFRAGCPKNKKQK